MLLLTATWTPVVPALLCVALLQHMESAILACAQQGILLVSRQTKLRGGRQKRGVRSGREGEGAETGERVRDVRNERQRRESRYET